MIEIINKKDCCGCFACVNSCPKSCIEMLSDNEGFLYPTVDKDKCVDCGLCEKVCPIINKPEMPENKQTALAVINKDETIRLNSSSGGVFSLLASSIIENGGVVFGAALSEDCKSVSHIAVRTLQEIEVLRGSKYVQSKIGSTYKEVKTFLENGKKVLFSGTPCQIWGLYAFLNKEYENLYTCDFVCHGVPSPLVWEKYVKFREGKSSSETSQVFFRNKKSGWKTYSMQFEFQNGVRYAQKNTDDLYLRGFVADLYLRPSCYDCKFKGINRPSNITLADFWGVEKVCPEMYDNKGTSLLILNSDKGKKLFGLISKSTVNKEVDLNTAISFNSAAIKSVAIPKKREDFFADLNNIPAKRVFHKYCKPTAKQKMRRLVGGILRKMKLK